MSLKDRDAAIAAEWAVNGWLRYVQLATRDLSPNHPVDERLALALAGVNLPPWVMDGVRLRLTAAAGTTHLVDTVCQTRGHG